MKFWKIEIIFTIYKDKPLNVYYEATKDTCTAKNVKEYYKKLFDYMGKNGILKMQVQEITEKEWFEWADSCKYPCSHEEWYDFFRRRNLEEI